MNSDDKPTGRSIELEVAQTMLDRKIERADEILRRNKPTGPSSRHQENGSSQKHNMADKPTGTLTDSERKRFFTKVDNADACLRWRAGHFASGHGNFYYRGKYVNAARIAYMIFRGPVTDGLHVLHNCDVPDCMNPLHLYLGTNDENIRDRQLRNRQARGTRNGRAKLTIAKIVRARFLYDKGMSYRQLGNKFGVNANTIRLALLGRTWRCSPLTK